MMSPDDSGYSDEGYKNPAFDNDTINPCRGHERVDLDEGRWWCITCDGPFPGYGADDYGPDDATC